MQTTTTKNTTPVVTAASKILDLMAKKTSPVYVISKSGLVEKPADLREGSL